MDVECMNRQLPTREKSAQMKYNWIEFLKGTKELHTVACGRTTIQIMDPQIMNRYIEIRYGKLSPCQFPFTNGVDMEKFPPAISSHDNETMSALTEIFQEDQDEAQMNFVLKNWYVPRKKERSGWKKREIRNKWNTPNNFQISTELR